MTTTDRTTTWRPDLHVRLARRYLLDLRATRAATAALVASLMAWVIGVDVTVHAGLMALAAVVGALVPARPPLTRAFGWIGREAGLAYQTHVEHDGRSDPYGLLAAAAVQARLTIRGVAPPPRSPWWLPLAATAVAVWLIAAVVGSLGGLAGFGSPDGTSPPPQPSPPPVTAPQTEAETDDAPESDEDLTEEPEASSPPVDPRRDADDGADTPSSEASEGEAVDRFLENLRERPAASDERATDPAERDLDRDGVREEEREDEQPEAVRRDDDAALEGSLRPTDERDEDAETIEADVPGGGEGEDGDADDDGDLEGTADGEGDEEPGLEQAEDGAGEGDDDGDTGEGLERRQEGMPGDDDTMGFDAGDGDDAGIGTGAPDETPATELGPDGDPEALPGMLLPGEETPGGRVRLPGRDDGHVPEGRSVERYERAVEQAVTDGTVPVPYQEIIRNYFR